jgi:hypothetical protein
LAQPMANCSSSRTARQRQATNSYTPTVEFDRLMAEGLSVDVEAYWGAGFPTGRYRADKPDWLYEATARAILAEAESALDMGTGEGGVLASLAPLPGLTVAYEGWWPTVPAAQATLRPLGVHLVVALGSADNVPRPDQRATPALQKLHAQSLSKPIDAVSHSFLVFAS